MSCIEVHIVHHHYTPESENPIHARCEWDPLIVKSICKLLQMILWQRAKGESDKLLNRLQRMFLLLRLPQHLGVDQVSWKKLRVV